MTVNGLRWLTGGVLSENYFLFIDYRRLTGPSIPLHLYLIRFRWVITTDACADRIRHERRRPSHANEFQSQEVISPTCLICRCSATIERTAKVTKRLLLAPACKTGLVLGHRRTLDPKCLVGD